MLAPSHGGLAPPPKGNPGSAPDVCIARLHSVLMAYPIYSLLQAI